MFKDVHCGHKIIGVLREFLSFEIDVSSRQTAPLKTPLAKTQQCGTDVRQRYIEAMARKENGARSDPSSKIQVMPAAVLPGEMQSRHIGKRRHIVTQRVPPHEFICGS